MSGNRADHAITGAYVRLRAQLTDAAEVIADNNPDELLTMARHVRREASLLANLLEQRARIVVREQAVTTTQCSAKIPAPEHAVVEDRHGHLARRHEDGRWGAEVGSRTSWATLWSLCGPLSIVGTYPAMRATLWPQGLRRAKP